MAQIRSKLFELLRAIAASAILLGCLLLWVLSKGIKLCDEESGSYLCGLVGAVSQNHLPAILLALGVAGLILALVTKRSKNDHGAA